MTVGRKERRRERESRVVGIFGEQQAPAVLDLLEITELAWHDCYGEVSPSEDLIDDMLTVSRGSVEGLVRAALLALTDVRDLKMSAQEDLKGK